MTATLADRKVATIRLRLDAPATAYFESTDRPSSRPVVRLPHPGGNARRTCEAHHHSLAFAIASEPDLLRLKRIAKAARSAPGDAEDIAFLESRRKRSR